MINLLSSYYVYDRPWCVNALRPYLPSASRVTVIPFSFRDDAEDTIYLPQSRRYCEIVSSLTAYGVTAADFTFCDYFRDSQSTLLQKIRQADVLYLTGGLPDRMLDRIVEKGIFNAIRAHRGLVIGLSAGAMVQLGDYQITPDEDYPHFCMRRGLRLVSGFGIEVHYEGFPQQEEGITRFCESYHLPVYAITNEGALLVENGRIHKLGDVYLKS